MNDAIVHFVIGSSPIVTIFPYFVVYNAWNKLTPDEKKQTKFSFEDVCVVIPILFGVSFALSYYFLQIIPRKTKDIYTRYVVCGAIAGVIVSLVCHYVFRIQTEWMGLESPNSSHIIVGIFYLALFYTIGQWLRSQILYGPTAPSSSSSSPSSSSSSSSSSPSSSGGGNPPPSLTSPSVTKFDAIKNAATKN
jgi:hypothetical protein